MNDRERLELAQQITVAQQDYAAQQERERQEREGLERERQERERQERERRERERQAEEARKATEEAAKKAISHPTQLTPEQEVARLEQQAHEAVTLAQKPSYEMWQAEAFSGVPVTKTLLKEAESATGKAEALKPYIETQRHIADIDKNIAQYDIKAFKYTDTAGKELKGTEAWEKYKKDVAEGTASLQALVSNKTAPFVTFSKDGKSYTVNLHSAVKASVSDADLRRLGISKAEIATAKVMIKKAAEGGKLWREVELKTGEMSEKQFKASHTQLPDKQWIANSDLTILQTSDPEGYKILTHQGFGAYEAYYKKQDWAFKMVMAYEIKSGPDKGLIDLGRIKASGNERAIEAAKFIFPEEFAEGKPEPSLAEWKREYAKAENALNKVADRIWAENPKLSDRAKARLVETTPEYQKLQELNQKVDIMSAEFAGLGNAVVVAAEYLVPGVYTARHWKNMSAGEKAFQISMDVIFIAFMLVPVVGSAAAGAREVATAGRLARLKGAATGVGRELLAQARAPIDVIIHPVGTAKATAKQVRNLAEFIANPRRLSGAVITTSDRITYLRVGKDMSEAEALAAQELFVKEIQKGKRLLIQIGDQEIELTRSPLMREVGGGLTHATPDIRAFELGTTVKAKPGMPAAEQGWFLTHEPATRFTQASAFGKESIPVPLKASDKLWDVAKFRADDLVKLDKATIRTLNFADARNIPNEIAEPLQAYAQRNGARLYGSFNEYLKIKGAAIPNDVDLAFRNQQKALNDILKIAKEAGFEAKRIEHGVAILKDGQWVKLGDIDSIAHHRTILPAGLSQPATKINGIGIETMGEQYLRQSYGAIAKDVKAAIRTQKLEKAASDVKKMLKRSGVGEMKPGVYITSPETAKQAIATEKLFYEQAEMEAKLVVGKDIPAPAQKLFTRIGPTSRRIEIWLEKPLLPAAIARLKVDGLIEPFKTPFKPAIIIRSKGALGGLNADQLQQLSGAIRLSGNLDQADNLLRAERAIRAARAVPVPLARLTGRVTAMERTKAQRTIQKRLGSVPQRVASRVKLKERKQLRQVRAALAPARLPLRPLPVEPKRVVPIRTGAVRVEPVRVETARVEAPRAEAPRTEPVRAETARGEIPRAEAPRAEVPREKAPRDRPPRAEPPRISPPRTREPKREERRLRLVLPPGPRASEIEKRQYIKQANSIGFRMGQLGGKDVWHVFVEPYTGRESYLTIVSDQPPEGLTTVKGPKSPFETVGMVKGKRLSRPFRVDLGFSDCLFTPVRGGKGAQVEFISDPQQRTTGDITIGRKTRLSERMPPISDRLRGISRGRLPRLSPRVPRITPKMPRLS